MDDQHRHSNTTNNGRTVTASGRTDAPRSSFRVIYLDGNTSHEYGFQSLSVMLEWTSLVTRIRAFDAFIFDDMCLMEAEDDPDWLRITRQRFHRYLILARSLLDEYGARFVPNDIKERVVFFEQQLGRTPTFNEDGSVREESPTDIQPNNETHDD